MARALRLAARGRGRTSPNPMVGATVVAGDGSIVGDGWHQRVGTPHAEVYALDQAGARAAGATLVSIEMSARQRVLSAVAHPNIAFMLLSLGILGLTVELWSPGAVLPGVVGALSLLLASFALQLLPVNYAGLLLIALGVLMLILEIKIASY